MQTIQGAAFYVILESLLTNKKLPTTLQSKYLNMSIESLYNICNICYIYIYTHIHVFVTHLSVIQILLLVFKIFSQIDPVTEGLTEKVVPGMLHKFLLICSTLNSLL